MLRLRELRLENEKTQSEIAKIFGVSRQVYANYENAINQPSLEMLVKMGDFFQCSTDYLLGRSDDFGNISVQTAGAQLTQDEERLLKTYRRLTEKNKMHVSAYAQVRLEEQDGSASSSLRWK